jgi:glycine dehydrogenase
MASSYGVYHGPDGVKTIAHSIHHKALQIAGALGSNQINTRFFDTLKIKVDNQAEVKAKAEAAGVNFRYYADGHVGVSVNEAMSAADVQEVIALLGGKSAAVGHDALKGFERTSSYMTHPVFNTHRSETEMLRYLKKLENKDLSLAHAMIALGSCTMKLNSAVVMMPITYPGFANLHPFAPKD